MANTSVVSDVLTALQARLRTRPGLSDVRVFRFGQNPDLYGVKHIVLLATGEGSMTFRGFPLGPRQETFTLSGALEARGVGGGDDAAQAALEGAIAILAEVEQALIVDATLDGVCETARLAAYRHRPGADDQNRYHVIEFDIEVEALIG